MTDKCLKCNQEIKLGKLVEKDGKKSYEKFNLDGSPHVCPTKAQGKQYVPPKPRQKFGFDHSIDENGKVRTIYWSTIEGFLGEIKADAAFSDMEASISTYLKGKQK